MNSKLYVFIFIIFSSCQKNSNQIDSIINSLSDDEVSQSFFKMNERLISSIYKYESKINFSDSLIKDQNIRINTNKIIANYYESLEFASVKNVETLYDLNHKVLLDSLLTPQLSTLHNQQEEMREIVELAKLRVQGDTDDYLRWKYIIKNQILYNHIFQFIFRYKLEEELKTEIVYPIVYKDSILPNKNRQLTIYLATNLENDIYNSFVIINGQNIDLTTLTDSFNVDIPILFEYNPDEVKDEIEISTYIQNKINDETKETRIKYKPIKR